MSPRHQRYAQHGPADLGEAELLGLVLGDHARTTGLRTSVALLEHFGGLDVLARASVAELMRVEGLGERRAIRLHAAFEVGRRALRRPTTRPPQLSSPTDAYDVLAPGLRGLAHEELHAVYVDRRHRVLAQRVLTRGSESHTVVEPRQVLRPAIAHGAVGIVLAHNHPSGDPAPSPQDRAVTRRVADAARVVGLRLLDHLVIGDAGYTSLAELGDCGL